MIFKNDVFGDVCLFCVYYVFGCDDVCCDMVIWDGLVFCVYVYICWVGGFWEFYDYSSNGMLVLGVLLCDGEYVVL